MSRRNQIIKILAPAAGKGPDVEMAAAHRVLASNPSFLTLRKLLSYHNRSIALLAARCLLLSGNAQHAEEHHPVVRRAQGQQGAEAAGASWASSTTFWAGLATAVFGLLLALDIGSTRQSTGIFLASYGALIAFIWRLAGKVKRDQESRQVIAYVRGATMPPVAWSLAAINSLLPMARDRDSEIRSDAITAIDPVIPMLRAEDRELLSDLSIHSMVALAEADADPEIRPELRVKLLHTLGMVGAVDTIAVLQKIEANSNETGELRAAAQSAIESIRDRCRHQHESEELLRPATLTQTESLLRPAENSPSDIQTLLHIPDQ